MNHLSQLVLRSRNIFIIWISSFTIHETFQSYEYQFVHRTRIFKSILSSTKKNSHHLNQIVHCTWINWFSWFTSFIIYETFKSSESVRSSFMKHLNYLNSLIDQGTFGINWITSRNEEHLNHLNYFVHRLRNIWISSFIVLETSA